MKCICYHIDQEDRIFYIGNGWNDFAESNQASALSSALVLNRNLFDFIQSWECCHIYLILFKRVRENKETIEYPFRCDSPDSKRFMTMRLNPLPNDGIELVSCIVNEEIRNPVSLLDSQIARTDDLVKMCSWCKKIEVSKSKWMETEKAVDILKLFDDANLPQLTHGMCQECFQKINGVPAPV